MTHTQRKRQLFPSKTRIRHQRGWLEREGGLVYHRYRDIRCDGSSRKAKDLIGTVDEYPTDHQAWLAPKVVENMRRINSQQPESRRAAVSVNTLMTSFLDNYCVVPKLSPGTIKTYRSFANKWIIPRWGDRDAHSLSVPEAYSWLKKMDLAPKSKNSLKWCLKEAWDQAVLDGLLPHTVGNLWTSVPVENGSKRQYIPDTITPVEFQYILAAAKKDLLVYTVTALCGCLGPRISEVLGLKWSQIDFKRKTIFISLGWTNGKVSDLKTEASRKKVPLTRELVDILQSWRKATRYNLADDWVFASDYNRGKTPRWADSMRTDHLKTTVGTAVEVMRRDGLRKQATELAGKNVGWHTFRHSYKKWQDDLGTPLQVQQRLLRHADPRTTQRHYGQDVEVSEIVRKAHGKVVDFAMGKAKYKAK